MAAPSSHPRKKVKVANESVSTANPALVRSQRSIFLSSLSRSVSPPQDSKVQQIFTGNVPEIVNLATEGYTRSTRPETPTQLGQTTHDFPLQDSKPGQSLQLSQKTAANSQRSMRLVEEDVARTQKIGGLSFVPVNLTQRREILDRATVSNVSSPFKLTTIRDLPTSANVDTISIKDILGDPLIQEAWVFNYCFDIDWLLQQLDPDVREIVQVKIVHGSWRREDANKMHIDDACRRYSNVRSIQAYLPDAFGTHHSKMFILFRHDDQAQVIIHTANMLAYDWANATQAVWMTPLLPRLAAGTSEEPSPFGSGPRFKSDLLAYLGAYGKTKLAGLSNKLKHCSFAKVRGALIASAPSRIREEDDGITAVAGHVALRRTLQQLPTISAANAESAAECIVICQVSSIATFKQEWLSGTLFKAMSPSTKARFSIIFPTGDEVRSSLDGYSGGGSIHLKAQSKVHQDQIAFLRPHLCRWAGSTSALVGRDAKRSVAQPHIKTYISFAGPGPACPTSEIRWALLTSANLSVQAWGTAVKTPSRKEREENGVDKPFVHIQSYELGVLIWPELFAEDGKSNVKMIPTFGEDTPNERSGAATTVVGLRMPYGLPIQPYTRDDQPWSSSLIWPEPDRYGLSWPASFQ